MDTFSHELHMVFFISIAIPLLIAAAGIAILPDQIANSDELLSLFWGDLGPATLAGHGQQSQQNPQKIRKKTWQKMMAR